MESDETPWEEYALVLLFDGTCGICTWSARWVRERDTKGRILAMPNQSPVWRSRFNVTVEQTEHEVHAIEPVGRTFAGAAAVNRVLLELGGKYARVGRLYQFAPVRLLEDAVYPLIARYRGMLSRWGDRPACDEPEVGCV